MLGLLFQPLKCQWLQCSKTVALLPNLQMANTCPVGACTVAITCSCDRHSNYHLSHGRNPDPIEDILYFLGVEDIFSFVPLASRQADFMLWPYLSVFCTCDPLCHRAHYRLTPDPRVCTNFYYDCRVMSDTRTEESYTMFSVD